MYRPFEEIWQELRLDDLVEFCALDGKTYRGRVLKIDPKNTCSWARLTVSPEDKWNCGYDWGTVDIRILTARAKLVPGYYPKRPTGNLSKTLKAAPPAPAPPPAPPTPRAPGEYQHARVLISDGLQLGEEVEALHPVGGPNAGIRGVVEVVLPDTRHEEHLVRVRVLYDDPRLGPNWGHIPMRRTARFHTVQP